MNLECFNNILFNIATSLAWPWLPKSLTSRTRFRGYKTWVQSQTQNKAQWLAACGHVSASSQSLLFILILRMNSSFITSRPDLDSSNLWPRKPGLDTSVRNMLTHVFMHQLNVFEVYQRKKRVLTTWNQWISSLLWERGICFAATIRGLFTGYKCIFWYTCFMHRLIWVFDVHAYLKPLYTVYRPLIIHSQTHKVIIKCGLNLSIVALLYL